MLAVDECSCGARRKDRQLGLEPTPDAYVARMVEVFREVRRVLRSDGTCWLNLGDSYFGTGRGPSNDHKPAGLHSNITERGGFPLTNTYTHETLKLKDLCGVPWRVAFALQQDGWYLRSDIIWSKPNPMPESVTDRPTKAHEYLFLLAKSPRYFFDQEAVREAQSPGTIERFGNGQAQRKTGKAYHRERHEALSRELLAGRNVRSVWEIAEDQPTLDPSLPPETPRGKDGRRKTTVTAREGSIQHRDGERWPNEGANVRSVWHIATQPYPEAHFATYPEELVRRCILAGTSERGCCPVCGKPWEREVERELHATRGKIHPEAKRDAPMVATSKDHSGGVYGRYEVTTLGWRPGCDCLVEIPDVRLLVPDPIPCTVLDPFLGSGTTAYVARKHGRRSIGIELNPDYCELAAKRMQQQSLEFAT